jgi:hypothetical protein
MPASNATNSAAMRHRSRRDGPSPPSAAATANESSASGGHPHRRPYNGLSAAPAFGTGGGVSCMFYETGQRSSPTIAVARVV